MKKHLLFTLAASVALAGVLRADDAAPAADAKPAAAAPAAEAKAAPAAESKTAAVAKNDAMGSLKAGNQLLDQGKYAEAAAYFEGIGEQVKDNGATKREPYRLNNLALAQLNLQKYDDAIANASKAISLKPDLAAAYNNLSAAYSASGKRDMAVDTLNKGIAAVKAKGGDTAKLEANLTGIQAAIEASKPKAQREAEAKAKAAADAAAAKVSGVAATADAAAAKAADMAKPAADAAQAADPAEKK
jgi:tetratricopeptide (TPR) repeat protein